MLKACSFFIVLVAVAVVLIPEPKLTSLGELAVKGALKVVALVHDETHSTGTSRAYRALDHSFRMAKLGEGLDVGDSPEIFEKLTNVDFFPFLIPARKEVKKTAVQIKNHEVDVPAYLCEPPNSQGDRVYLFFHGGMFRGKAAQEFGVSDELGFRAKANILTVDYRLMSRYTTQEAVSDMIAAYKWLMEVKKYKPEQIVITGCSGGGMAAILTGLQIVASGLPTPRGIVAGSPALGFELLHPGVTTNYMKYRELPSIQDEILEDIDALMDLGKAFDIMMRGWVKNKDYVLPLFNDAKGIAKTLIWAGGAEALASSVELGANHFIKQGADVTFEKIPHMMHCFASFFSNHPEGSNYLDRIVEFSWS